MFGCFAGQRADSQTSRTQKTCQQSKLAGRHRYLCCANVPSTSTTLTFTQPIGSLGRSFRTRAEPGPDLDTCAHAHCTYAYACLAIAGGPSTNSLQTADLSLFKFHLGTSPCDPLTAVHQASLPPRRDRPPRMLLVSKGVKVQGENRPGTRALTDSQHCGDGGREGSTKRFLAGGGGVRAYSPSIKAVFSAPAASVFNDPFVTRPCPPPRLHCSVAGLMLIAVD
ncbi:hypothetical protein OH76DRAFT_732699 [Lentinus brumalis]|uniref:Uncharacterized protein n=1 Tax=Lentinus brumalis TaxID=2498619 RepID=A0A371DS20_9APHY|nr:hypothetical protein OH76DRAFT_732699 [Polyporus brumalis]